RPRQISPRSSELNKWKDVREKEGNVMTIKTVSRTVSRHAPAGKGNGNKNEGKIRSYPAPRELATPTDLKAHEVRAVVEAINPLVADAFALYAKTKSFHWHLASSHYRDFHLLFDEQAASILESIDPLAERVRRIGGLTIRSIAHIAQLQTIADDNRDFVPADQMIQELIKDNRKMAEQQRAAIDVCDENRDTPTG